MAKTIQQFLQETTVPDHLQYKVDNWDHHSEVDQSTTKKMDAALGGRSFVTFPLHTEHYDADADVVDHLDKHGYSIKDYIKGIATIKKHVGDPSKGIPMREKHVEEKIGSVLQKTNAPEHILSAFANDPSRQSTKNPNQQHVVISTTPLAIGGMSTGTHWRNQSCMNMEGGSNSHYLRHDSEHGTHIAFLVNGDDHTAFQHGEPSNPVARIALKPYHADTDDGERDTIFRPETNTYGSGNSHFTHAVSKWANENYPALEDHEYEKNSRVYDDSGNNVYKAIGKEAVTKSLDQGINVVDYAGNSLDHHVIDHAIDYAKTKYSDNPELLANAVHNMANVGNLSTHHVAKLYAMTGKNASAKRSLAVYHGDKLSTNSINDYRNHYNDIPKKMLMSPKLPDEIVDNLHPNEYSYVRKSKLKEHHYDKVVDNYIGEGSGSFYTLRDMAGGLSSKHIDRMIDYMHTSSSPSKNSDIAQFVLKHKDFSKGQHEALLDALNGKISYQNSMTKNQIIKQSKYSTLEDVQKAKTQTGLSALASNTTIDESEHAKVAKIFVDGIKKSTKEFNHPDGFEQGGLVPETLSKHFNNQDYIDMSAKGHRLAFE